MTESNMNTKNRQIVETWIYQIILEDFWQNVPFPGNFIAQCTFLSSCEQLDALG